jgi:hypothetical protein
MNMLKLRFLLAVMSLAGCAAPPMDNKSSKADLVCTKEAPTGSRIREERCVPRDQAEQERPDHVEATKGVVQGVKVQ